MKNLLRLTIFLFACSVLYSCKGNDVSLDGNTAQNRMSIYVLNEEIAANDPYIRMVVDYDGWVMLDITSDGMNNRDGHPYMFLHKLSQTGYYLYGTPKSYVFYEFTDTETLNNPEKAIVVTDLGDTFRYAVVSGITTASCKEEQVIILDKSEQAKQQAKMPSATQDYLRDYNLSIFNTINSSLNELSSEIGKVGDVASLFKLSASQLVTKFWTNVAIPLAKYQIIAGNTELRHDVVETMIDEAYGMEKGMLASYIMQLLPDELSRVLTAAKLILPYTVIGNMWKTNKEIKLDQDNPLDNDYYPIYSMSWIADRWMYPNISRIEEYPEAYTLKTSVWDVTESTATVRGSFDYYDGGFIPEMGFVYKDYITDRTWQIPITPDESPEYTLTGLNSCTTYFVFFYVKDISGKIFSSPGAIFTTKGDLQISPSQMTFSYKGGGQAAKLSLLPHLIKSWSITSCPKWYSTLKGAQSLYVQVDETTDERSGDITVTAHLQTGETKTAMLKVKQEAYTEPSESWDGTKWHFAKGSKFDFDISIKSVADQDYTCSGFINSSWTFEEFTELPNGDLEMWGYNNGGSYGMLFAKEVQTTLKRTSATTATANIKYTLNEVPLFGGSEVHEKGETTIEGILIE